MRAVVIAVDNAFRRDDGVGGAVATLVRDRLGPETDLVVLDGEPSRILDAWSGADAAIVVDAMRSGAEPGTVSTFEVGVDPLPLPGQIGSTHSLGLAQAVDLAKALDRLPARVLLVGIEGREYGEGVGLSPAVESAVPLAAEVVVQKVSGLLAEPARASEEPV